MLTFMAEGRCAKGVAALRAKRAPRFHVGPLAAPLERDPFTRGLHPIVNVLGAFSPRVCLSDRLERPCSQPSSLTISSRPWI